MPLDRSFDVAKKLKDSPVFDGSGNWMKSLPAINLRVPEHVQPQTALQWELGLFRNDGSDISVQLYPAWDKDNFYLGAIVNDCVHIQRHSSNAIWQDDMLQYAISTRFDTVNSKLATASALNKYGDKEFNLGLALTPNGVINYSWSNKFRGAVGFRSNVTRQNNKTIYEVAVPWKFLGVVPVEGKAIRFSALVMNVDSPLQKEAPYRMEYAGGIAGNENASRFKTLVLKGEGSK